ncbi:MAG: sodium-dependent bicarbonate transport family permease, partial [Phenylobacterium sp.]|nr:sodium-dependent bicarbonate transport family permease [Phenylobacterium sp.]
VLQHEVAHEATGLDVLQHALHLGLSLGVAFPFNLILGLPLYALAAGAL